MKFHECSYYVGSLKLSRFIKRGNPSALTWATDYHFLRSLRHPNLVQIENYFRSERVIISKVNGSFSKWLRTKNPEDLFADGNMLPLFREMVIQLVGLMKCMIAKEKYPREFSMKDMFIKILDDNSPKLQVLILKVGTITIPAHEEETWNIVKGIVKQCFQHHGVNPSMSTHDFMSCIGIPTKNLPNFLENYPDQWDTLRKGGFLMESYSYSDKVSRKINASELEWPKDANGSTPWLVSKLVRHSEANNSKYDMRYPNDYVRLLRNSYKHFNKLPADIQAALGGDVDGLIRQVEVWSPRIWHILYVAVNVII